MWLQNGVIPSLLIKFHSCPSKGEQISNRLGIWKLLSNFNKMCIVIRKRCIFLWLGHYSLKHCPPQMSLIKWEKIKQESKQFASLWKNMEDLFWILEKVHSRMAPELLEGMTFVWLAKWVLSRASPRAENNLLPSGARGSVEFKLRYTTDISKDRLLSQDLSKPWGLQHFVWKTWKLAHNHQYK